MNSTGVCAISLQFECVNLLKDLIFLFFNHLFFSVDIYYVSYVKPRSLSDRANPK